MLDLGSLPQQQTDRLERLLQAIVKELDIPDSRYESAERSYKSVGQWLDRIDSEFKGVEVRVYPQGSFRLGTVIRPINGTEHYDFDVVCEVGKTKQQLSQAELKAMLGREIRAYAQSKQMSEPDEARRCWTLNYADGAQFHMDVLPSLPDGEQQVAALSSMSFSYEWAGAAIAITDIKHPFYRHRSDEWPSSNPKGYSDWFKSRMQNLFKERQRAMQLAELKASIEDIPEYRVKTPLQGAIQILKRHRDMMFRDNPDVKPISIIITTLAAHAYNQETTLTGALYSILNGMASHVVDAGGVTQILNPTDPRENFADKWKEKPEKKNAFFEWLEMAKADFEAALRQQDVTKIVDIFAPRVGRDLVERAMQSARLSGGLLSSFGSLSRKARQVWDAPHRKPMAWTELSSGTVTIDQMTVERSGFQTLTVKNDGQAIPKSRKLTFAARTDVVKPYDVYWQVLNTGEEAHKAGDLRGELRQGVVQSGHLTKKENSAYSGSHSVECFIVKHGYCVARSGPFIVNIT
ncbi:MAG: nucleotidyltransferase [Pseudomonadota bacterium]